MFSGIGIFLKVPKIFRNGTNDVAVEVAHTDLDPAVIGYRPGFYSFLQQKLRSRIINHFDSRSVLTSIQGPSNALFWLTWFRNHRKDRIWIC